MLYPLLVHRLLFVSPLCSCLVFAVAGCGDDGGSASSSGGSTSSADASTGSPTTEAQTTSQGSTSVADASTGQFDATSDTNDTNDSGPVGECLLWEADECGEGRKCMPYSLNDDGIPDEIQCCDAVENPDLDGEPCEVFDYNGSCLDSCAPGSMCVLDDEDSLSGLCRSFCDPAASDCGPNQTCKAFFEFFTEVPNLPTCMDQCDPLSQNCSPSGWHCIPDTPTESGQSGFLCAPPPAGAPNTMFEACALANQCEAGLVCVTDDRVPDCSFTSCCTAYCDLSEGDSVCQALHPDMVCTDWMSPDPSWSNVGACTLPQQ